MFLVPLSRKRILDSTLSSQQPTDNQSIYDPTTKSTTRTKVNDELQTQRPNNNLHCNQQKWLTQLHGILSHFIIGTSNLAKKFFIESLTNLKRCLQISLRTLLAILNSITSQCTESLGGVVSASAGGSGHLDSDSIRLVTHPLHRPITVSRLTNSNSHSRHLQAIAEATNWSEAATAVLQVTAASLTESRRNDKTIYYETIEPQISFIRTLEADNPHQCDTIEMDFYGRRVTQRAASNSHNHVVVGTPTDTTTTSTAQLGYWRDYQALPSASVAAAASNAQTCTSVGGGPQVVSDENKATESCRQRMRREQLRPQFQGHQEQQEQQRSFALQIEMDNCRRVCTQQQQIILLPQHHNLEQQQQLKKLQGSNHHHDTQIPNSSKYHTCVAQSSSFNSSSSTASFMSAHDHHHHTQKQHEQQGTTNLSGFMNFNAHSQQQQKQQYHPQRAFRELQDAAAEAAAEVVQGPNGASMILVSKETISNLTDQIALSMNKMKDLEERVRVIPELQRRLDSVISDSNSSSVSDSNNHLAYVGRNQNNNSNQGNNNSNYHHNNQYHNRQQDFSFSTDNVVAPYHNDGCNNSVDGTQNHRVNNSNRATNSDEIFRRGIHPSLQRHYGSFRCSTNNSIARDSSCYTMKDNSIATAAAAQTTSGNFNLRSPLLNGNRDLNSYGRGDGDTHGLTNKNSSRQSLPPISTSTAGNNMLRSNQNLNLANHRSSSPKVEYEDLINDLISLSYSVNYPSSDASLLHVQPSNSKLCDFQVKKELQTSPSKASVEHNDHQHQLAASKRSSPSLTKLDCGCQSFKEHLRYNSISREQRMRHARSQSASYTTATSNTLSASAQSTPSRSFNSYSSKRDASTNTDLYMDDIVTKIELNDLITSIQKTYSTLSSTASRDDATTPIHFKSVARKSSSFASESTSGSMSGPKSSSPLDSRSESCDDDDGHSGNNDDNLDDNISEPKSNFSSEKVPVDENDNPRLQVSDDEDDNEDRDDDEEEAGADRLNAGSLNGEGPYSLGSSYQDPSDFEEYCAYGESLDRRTKDFMSQSTKIPNDLRFALIRLNDFMKRNRSFEQIGSSSGCIEVIRKEWFEVAANKDSQPAKAKLYVDYFESFTKQLLNTVVNLCDNAGNTAMHYAASLYKLDIIKVLLETKVCDVNCRNKAGYTPIMLLALADIVAPDDQDVARHLFSMGDVNIKARMSGQTAIMLAASHGRISTCKLLLEAGADPSLQDYDGSTALMCGSEIGDEEVVRCLLAHKLTDPNAVDNDGLDALTIAMNNGHKNIGLILYAAKNVPRMVRSTVNGPFYSNSSGYLGASLRRSRGKLATNYVRRADSLLSSRGSRLAKHSQT